jgi:hypothetical protein
MKDREPSPTCRARFSRLSRPPLHDLLADLDVRSARQQHGHQSAHPDRQAPQCLHGSPPSRRKPKDLFGGFSSSAKRSGKALRGLQQMR